MSFLSSRRARRACAALAAVLCGGTAFESCTTRVRDDVAAGVRSYFLNDFLVALTCDIAGQADVPGCDAGVGQ